MFSLGSQTRSLSLKKHVITRRIFAGKVEDTTFLIFSFISFAAVKCVLKTTWRVDICWTRMPQFPSYYSHTRSTVNYTELFCSVSNLTVSLKQGIDFLVIRQVLKRVLRMFVIAVWPQNTIDQVILVARKTHHTPTVMSYNGIKWINMGSMLLWGSSPIHWVETKLYR